MFFTLSGFLITSLVVSERSSTGRVDLTAFWARRARRLIPASLVALLLALFVTAVAVPAAQQASAVGDIRSALFQFANWRFIQQGARYADFSHVAPPVQHYWSLAIEEQFYVVFPIIAAITLRRSKAALAGVFGALVALSVWQQAHFTSIEHSYYGTDSRAAEIAMGGLLALAYPWLRDQAVIHRRRLPDIAGFFGLAASAVILFGVPQQRTEIYHGGLAAFSIVSAMMVFGAVEGPVFRRLLSARPLVYIGRISYGIYLYHFPLFILLNEDRVGLHGYGLLLVRSAVSIGLAAVSYRWYELPIRRGVALKAGRAPAALLAGAAAVLLVAMPVGRMGRDELRLAFKAPATASTSSSTSTSTSAPVVPGTDPSTTATTAPTTTIAPARPPRVVVVGDSTAAANGAGLEKWGEATGRLQVVTVSEPGCGLIAGSKFQIREGYTFEPQRCDQLMPKAATVAQNLDADAIIVFFGSSQLADWQYYGLDGLHHIDEPEVDLRYGDAMARVMAELSVAGRPILWATVPLPMWDLAVFSQMIGQPVPGEGPISLNDPPRTVRLNQLNDAQVPQYPMAVLWPYAARLVGPDGTISKKIRPDGLHLSEDGVKQVASAWLFDVLGQAYRTVEARHPVGLLAQERQSWSAPGAPVG
jgi:peptidoglycan/LPS O-acetylase OafA/YrhL